jgi:hypothetical protein
MIPLTVFFMLFCCCLSQPSLRKQHEFIISRTSFLIWNFNFFKESFLQIKRNVRICYLVQQCTHSDVFVHSQSVFNWLPFRRAQKLTVMPQRHSLDDCQMIFCLLCCGKIRLKKISAFLHHLHFLVILSLTLTHFHFANRRTWLHLKNENKQQKSRTV